MASVKENSEFFPDILGCVRYPLDAVIDWLKENKSPEDVFSEKQLAEWAEANGYERNE
jgi:hypothetical protein